MSKHLKIAYDMAKGLEKVGGMDRITMREIETLCLPAPKAFTPEEIRGIRESSRMSQAVFAACLRVGISTIEQWERGKKKPSGTASKLLEIIERKGIEALC
jgi:putative transcriptional regulator